MITIIDYGVGNLRSVQKAFEKFGITAVITDNKDVINNSNAIVLPGVGAFAQSMEALLRKKLDSVILENIQKNKPFLGICLGMQLLFSESEEFGLTKGLNVFPGKVKKFTGDLKIPHMGWNKIEFNKNCPLLKDVNPGTYMYFVHSFYVIPDNNNDIAATSDYGNKFTAMVWNKNIFACQFHPEKSQEEGLKIIKAFGKLANESGKII